jgi:C-terminal processing protease CtpA/Prc
VPFPADLEVRLDTVYPMPRTIAVLIDEGCASSCEDFVLMARQSAKVTVVGPARTAGVHDYGNVRAIWLPGWRRLRVPTSRSRWLPAEAIDNIGLAPEVWVPAGTPDTIQFAGRAAMAQTRR